MRRLEVIWSASGRHKLPLQVREAISARLPSGSAAIKPPFDDQQAQPDSFVDRGLDEAPPNSRFDELVVRHRDISVLATGVRAMLQLDAIQQPYYMYWTCPPMPAMKSARPNPVSKVRPEYRLHAGNGS
jgi:hypothetical protein